MNELRFLRSHEKTEISFLDAVYRTFGKSFTTGDDAKTWLIRNGYFTDWNDIITSGLILNFDITNSNSFRGEPTVNYIQYISATNNIANMTFRISVINWNVQDTSSPGGYYSTYQGQDLGDNAQAGWTMGAISNPNLLGKTTTFSAYLKGSGFCNLSIYDDINGYRTTPTITLTSDWVRHSLTSPISASANSHWGAVRRLSSVTDIVSVSNVQWEDKSYATPFISGTRGTTVTTDGGLIDLSGNSNNGELISGPIYNSGYTGSLVFDGIDDYIKILSGSTQITTGLTVSAWVRSTNNSAIYQQGIISKANLNGVELGWILRKGYGPPTGATLTNKFYFSTGYPNHARYDIATCSDIEYTDNSWHHITGVHTTDGTNFIYIDGIKQTASRINCIVDVTTSPQPIVMGVCYGDAPINTTYQTPFQGNISIPLIYNRALSDEEILYNYNSTKSRFI